MTPPNAEATRQLLTAERERIMGAIEHLHEEQEGDGGHEQLDQVDQAVQLEDAERELVEQIDAALAAVEAGTYGTCSACGGEIPAARLEALPWAVRCITCEAQHEA